MDADDREGARAPSGGRRRAAVWATLLIALTGWSLHRWAPRVIGQDAGIDAELARIDRMALVYAYEDPVGRGGARRREPSSPYFVDRFEVTNQEFQDFVARSSYRPEDPRAFLWHLRDSVRLTEESLPLGDAEDWPDHPVVFVSADDARAYAAWSGKELPTDPEWRFASSLPQSYTPASGRLEAIIYYTNRLEIGLGRTTRVGTFESGRTRSPSTIAPPVYDLFGNVSEWTSTRERLDRVVDGDVTPGDSLETERSATFVDSLRVKGGAFDTRASELLVDRFEQPGTRSASLGFRCVLPDAMEVIGRIADRLVGAGSVVRERVHERLSVFDRPLERTINRMRFDGATVGRVTPAGGDNDVLLAIAPNRLVLMDGTGGLRLIDVETGDVLDRMAGPGELIYGDAVDLDGDGTRELYFATRYDAVADEGAVILDREGQPWIVDLSDYSREDWASGPRELEQQRDESFALPSYREILERSPFDRFVEPGPLLFDDRILGFVPTLRQILHRVDLAGDRFVTRWSRDLPISSRAWFQPEHGQLVIAGMRWFRTVEEKQVPVIVQLLALGADGETVAASGTFCSFAGEPRHLVPLGPASDRRMALEMPTGEWLLVSQHEDVAEEDRSGRMRPPRDQTGLGAGPPLRGRFDFEAELFTDRSVIAVRRGEDPGDLCLLEREGDAVRLSLVAAGGRARRTRTFPCDRLYPPRLEVDSRLGFMLRLDDYHLLCLDHDLNDRFELRDELIGLDIDRQGPVQVRFLDGPAQVLILSLDGFHLYHSGSMRMLDAWVAEDATVLSVVPVEGLGDSGQTLAVSFRDRALYLMRASRTGRDLELRRLLTSLRGGGP